jgi:HK97 family phage major capsid protein
MNLSRAAALEIHEISKQIDAILAKPHMSNEERKRADLLLAKCKNIRSNGVSTDEMANEIALARADKIGKQMGATASDEQLRGERRAFNRFLRGAPEAEIRSMLAGAQTISYTEGPSGGYVVPASFGKKVFEGLAQIDPLLAGNVVNLVDESTFALPPQVLPAWDLSTFKAVNILEGNQQTEQTAPLADANMTNSHTYRCSLAASFEWEEDSKAYDNALNAMARAFAVGFARGIGADLVNGNGTTAPQGILTAAPDSGITLDPTITNDVSNTQNDLFQDAYFSINAAYRNSPTCAWLMSDTTYQWIRSLTDKSGRPLLGILEDDLTLMGKYIYICPSLPSYGASPSTTGKIIFGDLSYFNVHASAMLLRRRTQTPGYVEYGKALYTGLLRVDSKLVDPTGGANPPIKQISLHP